MREIDIMYSFILGTSLYLKALSDTKSKNIIFQEIYFNDDIRVGLKLL